MKNIIILGCNGGMGFATSTLLKNKGENVIGLDIQDKARVEGISYYKCDIRSSYSVEECYKSIRKEFERIDAIVTLSGIYIMDSLLEVSEERLNSIIDINFFGIQRFIKTFFPLLYNGSKIIITTSEVAPLDPLPFNGIYSMTKSLLEKYAYSLRMEVDMFGIDVVCFRPGAVNTNLVKNSTSELDWFCKRTVIHKDTSKKFKSIVDKIESKTIDASLIAIKLNKIINKKRPKYVYKINNNKLLKLFNILPSKLQVKLITKLLNKR